MFDKFSPRARMIVFLTRKDAGRRGAAALEPAHLLEAIVREDQGELPAMFPPTTPITGFSPDLSPYMRPTSSTRSGASR